MFENLSLAKKVPILIGGVSILLTSLVLLTNQVISRGAALEDAQLRLQMAADIQKASVEDWFMRINGDLQTTAINPTTRTAITWFSNAWRDLEGNQQDILRDWYVTQNPHPVGQFHLFERSDAPGPYNYQHGVMHPYFTTIMQRQGYYDVFLFDLSGNLIYSVAKEPDFATNFANGPFAGSGLGQAYASALNAPAGETTFVDFAPYEASNGVPAAFLSTVVVDEAGEPLGVLAYQLLDGSLERAASRSVANVGDAMTYLIDGQGAVRAGQTEIGVDEVRSFQQVLSASQGQSNYWFDVPGLSGEHVASQVVSVDISDETWGVIVEEDVADIMDTINANRNLGIGMALAGAVISVVLGVLFARLITGPLGRTAAAMEQISQGQYGVEITDSQRGDEVGQMAKILDNFREKLRLADAAETMKQKDIEGQRRVVSELALGLDRLSDGDLTTPIETEFMPEYRALRDNYNKTIQTLGGTVQTLSVKTGTIRKGTGEIAQASEDLSRRTETMAATLEQIAAAVDELAQSVKTSAEGAGSAETIVTSTKEEATRSKMTVESAVQAMTEIERSSEHISQIIGVIDDIAFQTNLLALNAGVEAARAGTAGRGFAVVASEVRGLAQRSSEAAKEIKTLITSSADQVQSGVDLVGKTGKAIASITEQVSNISTLMTEISAGAAGQAAALGEINTGMSQLGDVTQQNAQMVVDVSDAGKVLTEDAMELAEIMRQFRSGDAVSTGPAVGVAVSPSHPLRPTGSFQPLPNDDVPMPPARAEPNKIAAPQPRSASAAVAEGVWEDF